MCKTKQNQFYYYLYWLIDYSYPIWHRLVVDPCGVTTILFTRRKKSFWAIKTSLSSAVPRSTGSPPGMLLKMMLFIDWYKLDLVPLVKVVGMCAVGMWLPSIRDLQNPNPPEHRLKPLFLYRKPSSRLIIYIMLNELQFFISRFVREMKSSIHPYRF